MIYWINKVWKDYTMGEKSMLILVEYGVHKTQEVKKKLALNNTVLDLILPGYTDCLQPLNVGMKKPFKDAGRKQFDRFMVNRTERQKVTRF